MYDNQYLLVANGPTMVAMLPNTGGETTIQIAIAVAVGMVVWGVLYSVTQKRTVRALA
jgi:LPXTG-motif cell wall-anchored protein